MKRPALFIALPVILGLFFYLSNPIDQFKDAPQGAEDSLGKGSDIKGMLQEMKSSPGSPDLKGAKVQAARPSKPTNTGAVSLDRTVYPVPGKGSTQSGQLTLHVQINDPDLNKNPRKAEVIKDPPVRLTVRRNNRIIAGDIRSFSECKEISPDAGIFQMSYEIPYMDNHVFELGDVVTVEYEDAHAAGGDPNLVTDSATLDLRDAAMQTDRSLYGIGEGLILTLIEPDLDLDNDKSETTSLTEIEWISDGIRTNLGRIEFDSAPAGRLQETGDSTGIFQSVITIPKKIDGVVIKPGTEVELRYRDQTPASARKPGDRTETVSLKFTIKK